MNWLLSALLGYLIGSIPFGLLLAAAAGKGDIRTIGSGNIGATNVLRTGSKALAAGVLLLDLGKGFSAVWLAARLWPEAALPGALGAVVGHCFPVWLRFKGGKGVATTAGVCFALWWPIVLVYAIVWLAMLAFTRISSVAGMSAPVAATIAALALGRTDLAGILAPIAALVVWLHRANIGRLRAGTEPKVGRKA